MRDVEFVITNIESLGGKTPMVDYTAVLKDNPDVKLSAHFLGYAEITKEMVRERFIERYNDYIERHTIVNSEVKVGDVI